MFVYELWVRVVVHEMLWSRVACKSKQVHVSSVPRHCVHQYINNNWRRDRNSVYCGATYCCALLVYCYVLAHVTKKMCGAKHSGFYLIFIEGASIDNDLLMFSGEKSFMILFLFTLVTSMLNYYLHHFNFINLPINKLSRKTHISLEMRTNVSKLRKGSKYLR